MLIALPWPDPRLMPNAKRRKHWTVYRPAVKSDRATGNVLATVALPLSAKRALAASEGKIAMTITFYPPDRRRRDDDGVIGSFKHLRDGIADALGVDDNRFAPTYVFAEPCKPGRVEVELPALASTLKADIMAAYEDGQITAEEAEDWIVLNGLGDA